MSLEILFQDDYYLAVNKPSGLFVHPTKEDAAVTETLLSIVKAMTGLYLYPLHRLDRPVSGVVLFALSSEAARLMQKNWHTSAVIKEYLCLVRRHFYQSGFFDFSLSDEDGIEKSALTHYWPLERFKDTSLMKVQIETGRRHQIRRHFSRVCHNLVGDTMYGKGKTNQFFREHFALNRIFLHAHHLSFIHPYTAQKIELTAALPDELTAVLVALSNQWLTDHSLLATD